MSRTRVRFASPRTRFVHVDPPRRAGTADRSRGRYPGGGAGSGGASSEETRDRVDPSRRPAVALRPRLLVEAAHFRWLLRARRPVSGSTGPADDTTERAG